MASAVSDNSNSCAGGTSSNTNAMVATQDPGLHLSFVSNTTSSPSTLLDAAALVEESYDGTGAITSASFATGGSITYAYSTVVIPGVAPVAGLLLSVIDQFGRVIQFSYEQPYTSLTTVAPRINSITAPDGAVTHVTYDSNGNLATLQWPDSNIRNFRYENTNLPWALTGITDEVSANYSSYNYDANGLAISTQLGSGVNLFTVSYGSPPSWGVTETVTPTLICRDHHFIPPSATTVTVGGSFTKNLTATTANGTTKLSSETFPAGAGYSQGSSNQIYDNGASNGHGNVTAYNNVNGNQSCFTFDTNRDLETIRVEGRPSTLTGGAANVCPVDLSGYSPLVTDVAHPERKTTTVWHPDWILKAQEAAPKKITTWVYNGQADPIAGTTANCVTPATTLPDGKPLAVLCTRYEQATTDATGALGLSATVSGATRAWTYTYNQYGQVLTETTPKQSSTDTLSHTTTYTYYATTSFTGSVGHTMGDLQTVTNPLGQVTTFTSYDMAGRVISSTDANGTVTSMSYLPRGWLHTQTVTPASGAALTTTYAYWPTGLLQTVTMPDASTLSYTYDDAHRLTDVVDGAGNKVHYVLDNVGNRTSEQVSDASGQLASTVARVYDALNRVQSTTGAMH